MVPKCVYGKVHRVSVPNSPRLETSSMSVDTGMDKYLVVYHHSARLDGKENEQTKTPGNNVNESLSHTHTVRKRSPTPALSWI